MACFFRLRRHRSTGRDTGHDRVNYTDQEENYGAGAKNYNWDGVKRLTKNFSRVIGSGGFSTVFLAQFQFPSFTAFGAVKVHGDSDHLNRFFKQELDILRQLQHPNIVKLLGYCDDELEERNALVLEFVGNGTLQDKLHGGADHHQKQIVISWERRMAIAYQLAQALEYLHEKCTLQIVHGDIKASNILLDEQLNCKLCDFGSAKMGFSSMVMPNCKQVMMGSPGYTDPHYLRTGIVSKKNDIYSYGVIILELVTGMEAFCLDRGQLSCREMEEIVVDPRLGCDLEIKEVRAMLSLSALCLGHSPVLRPSATQILQHMRDNVPSIGGLATPVWTLTVAVATCERATMGCLVLAPALKLTPRQQNGIGGDRRKSLSCYRTSFFPPSRGKSNETLRLFSCKCQLEMFDLAPATSATYGALLLAGGIFAYSKSKSKGSLFGGLTGATLMATAYFFMQGQETKVIGDAIGFGSALLFTSVFGIRLAASRKLIPSGLLLGLSICASAVFWTSYFQDRV
ncbi:probable receptor-like protein kinase At4g10390 [Mercurialis annua]|uniref:probable receptor-like protein kinase At4g10390 n=1 Tax=Mercurialis annua TaxID=3986 RepID=UPI00215F118A|nr:probable receptor-like protein kinase At4g10390 [Mercurialis annua]